MLKRKQLLIATLLLTGFFPLAYSANSDVEYTNCRYVYPNYDDVPFDQLPAARGWYFYEEPELVCDTVPKKPKVAEKKPEPKQEAKPEPKQEIKENGPKAFSTKWIRDNIEKYQDLAIDNPTEENIRALYAIQRIAMDRAETFAQKSKYVITGSELDENTRRPQNTFGANITDDKALKAKEALLKMVSKKAGIVFVYDSECLYCIRQSEILNAFKKKYGIEVKAWSVDAKPLKNGLFPDFEVATPQLQAARKIQQVPALFLVNPESNKEPIPFQMGGFNSYEDVRDKLLMVAVGSGVISEKDFDATRPFDSAKDEKIEKLKTHLESEKSKDGFIDPKQISKIIKGN